MVLIYVVCKDIDEAQRIGMELLQRRLAGCINMFPIQSAYWWEGQIVQDHEAVLLVKTLERQFSVVQAEIIKLHSYSVPAVLKIPVDAVEPRYFGWLKNEVC
jgi:periplasmic divalent cation tolerance protein